MIENIEFSFQMIPIDINSLSTNQKFLIIIKVTMNIFIPTKIIVFLKVTQEFEDNNLQFQILNKNASIDMPRYIYHELNKNEQNELAVINEI